MSPYLASLAVALIGFWSLWPLSIKLKNVSIVDFFWAPGFVVISWVAWWVSGSELTGVVLLTLAIITAWGTRLGITLGARQLREGAEDPRYVEMREAREPGFWWKSFFIVFTLQAVVQTVVATVLIAIVISGAPITPLAYLGAAIAVAGALIEARSDWELDQYRKTTPHGGMLTTGLRAYVRFPSYAGDIIMWSGFAIIGLSAGILWAPLNAILVAAMLIKLSGVAILDDRFRRTRPGYANYEATTPALFPRLGGGALTGSQT